VLQEQRADTQNVRVSFPPSAGRKHIGSSVDLMCAHLFNKPLTLAVDLSLPRSQCIMSFASTFGRECSADTPS
jgi:hypothetical protein